MEVQKSQECGPEQGSVESTRASLPSAKFSGSVCVHIREEESDSNSQSARSISEALGLSPITSRILVCRGIKSPEAAERFLAPVLKRDLPDPFQVKNIEQAADLMLESARAGRQITVYSDFDVDGLSSASQLVLFLETIGAKVNNYTPNRFTEGYGLTAYAVRKLASLGTEVLVTVDCGISNFRELALARSLGMRTIVVDHHHPQELPPADVIVNPAQEGCPFAEYQLAAAGLVWLLLIVLRAKLRLGNSDEVTSAFEFSQPEELPDPKDFLDLAALGTICDMVPLTGLNRLIAHRGLEALRRSSRPGLKALKEVAGLSDTGRFTSGNVAFGLGPRINAAGRLGDAGEVFKLLTTKSPRRAKRIAEAVEKANSRRRDVEEQVRKLCLSMLSARGVSGEEPAFALYNERFHIGVIGIVAQRLVEHFYRPVALMAPAEDLSKNRHQLLIRGSVRGIRGFHVAEVLESLRGLCVNCGGHEGAGGFTLKPERLSEFSEAFVKEAGARLEPEMLQRRREADVIVCFSDIDFVLVQELERLSPFGVGNSSPLLVSRGVDIESVVSLANGHLRLRMSQHSHHIQAVAWGYQGHPLLRKGERINIAFHPEINVYKGVSSVQLNLQEVWSEE